MGDLANGITITWYRCGEARRNPFLKYNHSMYLEEMNYTTVVVFRDPFERAYSAYRNSDINRHIFLDDCTNTTDCTFEEWVNSLFNYKSSMNKIITKNEHYKTQVEIAK